MVKEIVILSAVAWHSDDNMQAETSTVAVWLSCSSPGMPGLLVPNPKRTPKPLKMSPAAGDETSRRERITSNVKKVESRSRFGSAGTARRSHSTSHVGWAETNWYT